jgi:molecular chaperone DnaK
VKATNGDTFLGGEDFDNVILKHLVAEFKKEVRRTTLARSRFERCLPLGLCLTRLHVGYDGVCDQTGVDLSGDRLAMQRLRESSEKAKVELSSTLQTEVNIPYITSTAKGPLHLLKKISRSELERLTDSLIQRSVGPCEACIKDANIAKKDIHEVLLVGGMTRMPKVQQTVEKFFGKPPNKSVNPDEVVAAGASIQVSSAPLGLLCLLCLLSST